MTTNAAVLVLLLAALALAAAALWLAWQAARTAAQAAAQAAETRAALSAVRDELAALRAATEAPLPPLPRHAPSLDDLREQLRAARLEEDAAEDGDA